MIVFPSGRCRRVSNKILHHYTPQQYGILLLVVFVAELTGAVFATLLQGEVANMLIRTMFDTLHAYPVNPYAAQAVDVLQDKVY